MPEEIDLGHPPAGYAFTSARSEEKITIQFLEFTSSEDGQHFIQRLEGIPNDLLVKMSAQINPSQVDNMLAIFHRSGKATVYVNEIKQKMRVRASGPIKTGEVVKKSDIIEMDRLELNVQIPDDAGVLFVFSVGWRKGLFYDFGPVGCQDPQPRKYDLAAAFGQAYCQVLFQERFSISDAEWDALFTAKWFPFSGLRDESIYNLIKWVRSGWNPDELLDDIVAEVKDRVPLMLDSWQNHSSFAPHVKILVRAVERFQNDDYISCTGLLFPRIEGILRTYHSSLAIKSQPSQDTLPDTAVREKIGNEKCLLLPHRFAAYLRDVYFANFNPIAQDIDVSRNSVAHGVASASEFNQKSAVIGLLVIHQLFYFLGNKRS